MCSSDPPSPGGALTTYWCLIGTIGTATPASWPTEPDAAPAAFTTTSVVIGPASVTTPRTRRRSTVMPVTRTPVANSTPNERAPAASAAVSGSGRRKPSPGSQPAASTSPTSSSGNRSAASAGDSIDMARP
jgi:hypothetical protein